MQALEELKDLETQDELIRLKSNQIVSDTIFLTNLRCLKVALETGDFSGVEQGVVEEPFVPMIRFVSPVFISESFQGFIINYQAKELLDDLGYLGSRNIGRFVLLHSDGYFLYSPDKEEEWGFMFPDRDEHRYSLTNPEMWSLVSSQNLYQSESREGIVSSRIIRPFEGLNVHNIDYRWIAVNNTPGPLLEGNSRPLMVRLFLLGFLLFLLSSVPAWSIRQIILRRRQQR